MSHDSEPLPPVSGPDEPARRAGTSPWLDALWVLALAVGAAAVWLGQVNVPDAVYGFGSGDAFGYFLPAYTYEAERLAAGSFPTWNPYQGAGVPFVATLQPGALYPARLLTLLTSPALAMGWSAFAHVVLALLGTYALSRRLGASGSGAAIAGVVYSTGFALTYIQTASFLESGAWLPLLAWMMVSILRGGGWGWVIALGVGGAMPLLAGGYQVVLYTVYGLAIVGLAALADRRPRAIDLARLAVAGGLALATSAPQLLTTLAWSAETMRPPAQLTDLQMLPLFTEAARWGRVVAFFQRATSSDFCYLSIPVVALASVALVAARPFGTVLGLAALVTGYFSIVHPDTIAYTIYRAIPGFGLFRFPPRILMLTAAFAAVAAALGLTAITRIRFLARPRWRALVELVALGVVVWLLVVPYRSRTALPWMTAPLTAPPLDQTATLFFPGAQRPGSEYRVWVPGARMDLGAGAFVRTGMREKVRVLQDYEPMSSRRLGTFFTAIAGLPPPAPDAYPLFTGAQINEPPLVRPALLNLISVRAMMTPARTLPAARLAGWRPLARYGDLLVSQNDRALPRAYVVDRVRFVADDDAALGTITAGDFNGYGEAVVVGVPERDDERALGAAPVGFGAPMRIVIDEPEHVRVAIERARPGLLVLADAFAPGWEVTVDGAPRRLWQANYLVRGVVVGPGVKQVDFRYRAPGFALGLAIAAAAWGLVVLSALARRLVSSRAPAGGAPAAPRTP